MAYNDFASVYDRLMSDCDYSARADYLLGLFRRNASEPKLMLDLACGTGSLAIEMIKRGVDVIGVDPSAEMLNIAKSKAAENDVDLLCLCQSGEELDLFGTVDSAVCTLDSINHICDYDELKATFSKVNLFLEPNGLFIFDVNTEFKHKNTLADNTFVIEDEDVYCVWQNMTDMPYTTVVLDGFTEHDGLYERFNEEFEERAYSVDELTDALRDAGFEVVEILGDMTLNAPQNDCERMIFVTRKMN